MPVESTVLTLFTTLVYFKLNLKNIDPKIGRNELKMLFIELLKSTSKNFFQSQIHLLDQKSVQVLRKEV